MTSNKRGSLSLSIESVVVLVLAIAMLGLGLGFSRGMFNKTGDALRIPSPDMYASESDPLVTYSDIIELDRNKAAFLPVKYYKAGTTAFTEDMVQVLCPAGVFNAPVALSPAGFKQDPNTEMQYMVYIHKGFLIPASAICTLRALGNPPPTTYVERQITLKYKD
jgi:hypothetical protein